MQYEAEHVLAVRNQLGEGPIWHRGEQALYWLDILSSRVQRFHPASQRLEVYDVSPPITALGRRVAGGWVVATTHGFSFWDPIQQRLEPIAEPEAHKPGNRFNDGAVDPGGRFWAGTMNRENAASADGSLYRLDPDCSVHAMGSGYACSNGIGWSPDQRTMYFTDTFHGVIYAFDYDPSTGAIERRWPFVKVPEGEGYADGLVVDSEGYIWSARWGGWKVVRLDPNGKVEREVRLPAAYVTSCEFGGPGLGDLYITTASTGLSEAERSRQPLAGDLFRISTEVHGLERFGFQA